MLKFNTTPSVPFLLTLKIVTTFLITSVIIFAIFVTLKPFLCLYQYGNRSGNNIICSTKMSNTGFQFPQFVSGLPTMFQDFQKVGSSTYKLYVYSAYFEEHFWSMDDESSVIVITGLKANYSKPIFCIFYNSAGERFNTTTQAKLKPLQTANLYWHLPYVPYYIFCNLNINSTEKSFKLPTFVSIVESEFAGEHPKNLLTIQYKENSQKYNFTLCAQPLYNYENPFQLVEWIELHRMMGIEKITLYNSSIGPKTSCLIQSYEDFIEIFPWTNPYRYMKDMISEAQILQQHDCLERYKGISEYLVIVDVDEIILPSAAAGNNYHDMMESMNKILSQQNRSIEDISAYIFRNGFFRTANKNSTQNSDFSNKENALVDTVLMKMQTVTRTKRRKALHPHDSRAKYIVVPKKVIEIDIHNIPESVKNATPAYIEENIGYVHHYRVNCPQNKCGGEAVLEDSANRFAKTLAGRIADHLNSKAKHCNIEIG